MFRDILSFPSSGLMTTRMIRLLVFNSGCTLFRSTLGNLLHSFNFRFLRIPYYVQLHPRLVFSTAVVPTSLLTRRTSCVIGKMSDLYLRGTGFQYQLGYSGCLVFSPVFKLIPQYVVRQSSDRPRTLFV